MNAYELAMERARNPYLSPEANAEDFKKLADALSQQATELDTVIPKLVKANGVIENLRIRISELEKEIQVVKAAHDTIACSSCSCGLFRGGKMSTIQEAQILAKHQKDRIAELEKEKKERALQRLSDFTQEADAEPAAFINVETRKLEWAKPTKWETPTVVKLDKIPLYTTPQKKPLNDEEKQKLISTLKWSEDLLREAGHEEAVSMIQDCIVIVRMKLFLRLVI